MQLCHNIIEVNEKVSNFNNIKQCLNVKYGLLLVNFMIREPSLGETSPSQVGSADWDTSKLSLSFS